MKTGNEENRRRADQFREEGEEGGTPLSGNPISKATSMRQGSTVKEECWTVQKKKGATIGMKGHSHERERREGDPCFMREGSRCHSNRT